MSFELTLFDEPEVRRETKQRRRRASLDRLPPSVDLMTAAGLLGIGRTCAYGLIRRDEWPTPVIRVGRCIRIPTAPLIELLRGTDGGFPQSAAEGRSRRIRSRH
jgi:hypothetical protein